MYKEKIEKYIEDHRQDMLDDICLLCRINSERSAYQEGKPFGDGPSRALAQAMALAEKYGFSINNYDNYVATADLNDKERRLDILAHLDVVPAGDGWTVTEPFEPVERDGKLYGRGTSDDKGPAVAALYAMRAVKELGIPVSGNVRLILGTDEECGSSDIDHYYDVEPEAPMTVSPDGHFPVTNIEKGRFAQQFSAEFEADTALPRVHCIKAGTKINVVPGRAFASVEGLDDDLIRETGAKVTEETGVLFEIQGMNQTLEINAVGEGAHASTPEEGKNALSALLLLLSRLPLADSPQSRLIRSLSELFPWNDTEGRALGINMKDEISGALTMAFSMLEMDESSMSGAFDSRTPICGNKENVADPICRKFASCGITLEGSEMTPPHYVKEDSEFIKTLLDAYERYTGQKGYCSCTGGGTYVHSLKNGVAYGASMPGTDNRMHGADEFAVIDELLMCAKIYAQVIADLCR